MWNYETALEKIYSLKYKIYVINNNNNILILDKIVKVQMII